jgi:uncharacterized membrane protein
MPCGITKQKCRTKNNALILMDLSLIVHKHKYKIAFGFFIAYLLLSMYKIGENGLWYDECFSIDLGNDPIENIIDYSLYVDTNPPLYLLIIHYWVQIFGDSELALRSVSAISASIGCGMFFLLVLRFFNWQTAIFTMLLYFTSNELYYYSEEGRTYGLILMLCILSNFAFLKLIEKPNWLSAILLGLYNIAIFYSHTLGCINIVGQGILIFILGFNKDLFFNKTKAVHSFLGYKLSLIIWYIVSWIVFLICFWPWKERFFGIIKDGAKGFWLQKPTIIQYKQVLYDFYNSKNLFYVYVSLLLLMLVVLLVFKKSREQVFKYKLLAIPLILGPFLFHFNFFAASITPIFLKRYILFTLPCFILLFAYLLASLKINFKIKLGFILILVFCSAYNMKVPREPWWDYKNGVEALKAKVSPTTYITTDNPMVFSYYFDRKNAFNVRYAIERENVLAKSNIFAPHDQTWPETTDFSKYTDIYFTRSFDAYNDPGKIAETSLRKKFTWIEDLYVLGMFVSHFSNLNIPAREINSIKDSIILNDEPWCRQIKEKALKSNITVDSMMTLDAIWYYKTVVLPKK